MKRTILIIATLLSLTFTVVSCQKEMHIEKSVDQFTTEEQVELTDGNTILGDTIDIPYSIDNLIAAYQNLPVMTKAQINPDSIQPTHYYVKFSPNSVEELDILRNIKPYVFLSEIPLDRKVVVGGSYYHDPSIPEGLPTYQYTVIPVDRWESLKKSCAPVEVEILIKAFIPDYDEAYTTKSASEYGIPAEAYESLLQEAYRITGNKYDKTITTKASWSPSGRIMAYDDFYNGTLPVPGVRVRATHLLKVKETLTDEYGYFSHPSFSNPVNMRIIWESDDWDIRNGGIVQATFDGPQLNNTSWQCVIGPEHEKNVRYAAIQRAAYRLYYGDADGLYPPILTNKLKICLLESSNSIQGAYDRTTNNITIHLMKNSQEYYSTEMTYFSTAQEIGHASHHSWAGSDYSSYCKSIIESWSIFVACILCNKEYFFFPTNFDNWPLESSSSSIYYTPIFIDLFDDDNQSLIYPSCPNDDVTGFSPSAINLIMLFSRDLSSLKTTVKANKPQGVTDAMIDTLFNVYESSWAENNI